MHCLSLIQVKFLAIAVEGIIVTIFGAYYYIFSVL